MSWTSARNGLFVLVLGLLLMGLAMLWIQRQRMRGLRQLCEARQIRVGLAFIQSEIEHGYLPGYHNVQALDSQNQVKTTGWVFPILPHLHPLDSSQPMDANGDRWIYRLEGRTPLQEQGPYADIQLRYGASGPDATRGQQPQRFIPELVCPENRPANHRETPDWMSFVANCGMPDVKANDQFAADWRANGVFTDQVPTTDKTSQRTTLQYIEAHDGLANTVLISENIDSGMWTDVEESRVGMVWSPVAAGSGPRGVWSINQRIGQGDGAIAFARPSSYHASGVNITLCDGSTRFIDEQIDPAVWARLMMSDGKNAQQPGTTKKVPPPYGVPTISE